MRATRTVPPTPPSRPTPRLLASSTIAVGLLSAMGCQPPPKPAPPPPAPPPVSTESQMETTRQLFTTIDPRAKVGQVRSVDTAMHLAVVKGISLGDVKAGDTISLTNPDRVPMANGTITGDDASHQFLIVDYQKAAGGRDPMEGDMAIAVPIGR